MKTGPVVWDVFPYHNERLVLEIRKRELRDEGFDYRPVPIESLVTFTGGIRAQALDDSFLLGGLAGSTPMEREEYARRATRWALQLKGAEEWDYVLFGDVDEIPHGDAIQTAVSTPGIKCLRMPYHSLLATWRLPLHEDQWNFRWPVIGLLHEFNAVGDWSQIRARSGEFERIENCGWHLSSMGGPDVVLPKIEAFAHAGEPWTEGLDSARLRSLAERGRDVADRFDQKPVPSWELPFALIEEPYAFGALLDVKYWPTEGPWL